MGGSLAMRLRTAHLCRSVGALVRREDAAREATALGVVDWATTDPTRAFQDADIVIFSTPVRVLITQLTDYAPLFKPGTVITDMGSTKREIITGLAQLPPGLYPVGSHPMCGKETSGLGVAESTLYEGATWVISPLPQTPPGVISLIRELAASVGANPLILDAQRHDKAVAAISHVPYLLSVALVRAVESVARDDEAVWQVAASGFKDTSRLAASNATMMHDILLTNRDEVIAMLSRVQQQLDALTKAVNADDESQLEAILIAAGNQRRSLYPPV